MKSTFFIIALTTSLFSYSQQLVYTPKNPAFGGNTFNHSWMLSAANAQNTFSDPLEDFGDFSDFGALNNSLGSQLLQNQFDGQLPEVGTTTEGNLEYEVYESNEGLVINILDITTGEQSQIIIPNQNN